MLNLTGSKLRQKLLGLYFSNPDSYYYIRELAKILDVDPTNLSKELYSLENKGLFLAEFKGKQKYYKINKAFPAFKELKSLISKTFGLLGILRQAFGRLKGADLIILYGSVARGEEDQASDLDIFIVSDLNSGIFYDLAPELEKKLGREINFTIYSKEEFKRKKKLKDPFLENIFKNKYEIISGQYEDLKKARN